MKDVWLVPFREVYIPFAISFEVEEVFLARYDFGWLVLDVKLSSLVKYKALVGSINAVSDSKKIAAAIVGDVGKNRSRSFFF